MTKLDIIFAHAAPTPHNNYLLDAIASSPNVTLHRYYIHGSKSVPGRPWNSMSNGDVQSENIHVGINRFLSPSLIAKAITDKNSVFFIVGWDHPVLVIVLLILSFRHRPVLMWDDGPSPQSVEKISSWSPKQIFKRFLIKRINATEGKYFYTGGIAKGNIQKLGIRSDKLAQLPFFTRPARYDEELRAQHLENESDVMIFAGGRLVSQKGFDILLRALAGVHDGLRKWKVILVGSGPMDGELRRLITDLNLASKVELIKFAEPELFACYIHSADIFLAPARYDHFPTTVIAAMNAGVPVIASENAGSAVEFVKDGESGFILPVEDVDAFARAISTLVEDEAARRLMGKAAKQAIAAWSIERGVNVVIEAAEEAVRRCAV